MQLQVMEEALLELEPMSDEQFFDFCARNPEYRIERTAEGRILVMSGTGGKTGNRNMELSFQLQAWSKQDGRGVAFDSSTLFRLPNTAMRSPDAAWVSRKRLATLSEREKEQYLPLCPEFVVELTSPSDRLPEVEEKMREWMANGCLLGWLLHAEARHAHVYRPGGVEVLKNPPVLQADEPLAGFALELKLIWDPGW